MSRFKRAAILGAATAALAAGACSESTAPATVDPTAMATAVTTLNASFAQNQMFLGVQAVAGAGPLGAVVARAVAAASPRPAHGLAAATQSLPLFFANVYGKTFQWDTTSPAKYRITDSLATGAPSDGVRFLLYPVDSAGKPSSLVIIGHLDLHDANGILHVVLGFGTQTAADYTIAEQKTTASLTLTASGTLTNVASSGPTVSFTLSHVLNQSSGSVSTDYQASDGSTAVSLVSTVTASGGDSTLAMDWKATKGGTVEIVGTSSVPAVNLTFKFNGATIATAVGSQANLSITPLTAPLVQLSAILVALGHIQANLDLLITPGALVFH